MKGVFSRTAAAIAAVAGLVASPAAHADFLGIPRITPYAHLDLGFTHGAEDGRGNLANGGPAFGGDFDNGGMGGLGFGLYLPPIRAINPVTLRFDVSGGYRYNLGGPHTSTIAAPGDTTNGTPVSANLGLQNATLLFSLYADIPTGTRLTPFLGAGFGPSWNWTDPIHLTIPGSGEFARINDASNTDIAWTVAAGFNYAVNEQISFDVGYHFIDAGQVQSGNSLTSLANGRVLTQNGPLLYSDLMLHEFTASFRFTF